MSEKCNQKISIYQVLPRLFGNDNQECKRDGSLEENGVGKMDDFTDEALHAIVEMGHTHIWYTGLLEHATLTAFPSINVPSDHHAVVKGKAGSPYAIKDYYDIAPALSRNPANRIAEFEELIDRTHRAGLRVIIDFVPNHVSRVYRSNAKPPYVKDFGQDDDTSREFSPDNNFYYLPLQTLQLDFGHQEEPRPYSEFPAKVTGNDCFSATPSINDWYETVKLNYGIDYRSGGVTHFDPIPNTWKKMLDILLYWTSKGVDGFRCDMAEMVPTAFWSWAISNIKAIHDQVLFIAEVYQPHLYRSYINAGFDYLYDKVDLYDTLIRIIKGEAQTHEITQCWQRHEGLYGHLLHFMENHDEQRLASDFIVRDPKIAFPAMAVSALIDTAPIMTYFGQELGERGMDEEGFSGRDGRTSIFDYWSLRTIQRWRGADQKYCGAELTSEEQELRQRYQRLLQTATSLRAFVSGHFFDLMYANGSQLSDRHFAFLRSDGADVALVVANFSDQATHLSINIPKHAFETLYLKEETPMILTEINTERKGVGSLSSQQPFELEVPAHDVAIYYFEREFDPHTEQEIV